MSSSASAGKPSRPAASFIARHFLEHPATVNETYFEHMAFALRFFRKLFVASGAALIHAFVPSMCKTTASRAVREMFAVIDKRG